MCWDEKIKKLKCGDIQLIKLASLMAGLVIFKGIKLICGWDVFEEVSIWWLLVLLIIFAIKPAAVLFGGKKEKKGTLKSESEKPKEKIE